MFRKGCFSILVVALGLVVLAGTQAYAVSGNTADALAYDYYALRGTANIISVGGVTTAPRCVMPVPSDKQAFTYTPVAEPVIDCNPALAKPIGVGGVAVGRGTVNIKVGVGPFEAPVDVSIGIFMASFDATDIYFINVLNQLTSLQEELAEEFEAEALSDANASSKDKDKDKDKDKGNGNDNNNGNNGKDNGNVNNGSDNSDKQPPASDDPKPKKKFKRLTVWKGDVMAVYEVILDDVKVDVLPSGLYVIILNVTRVSPADNNFDRFYRWVTYFIVPDKTQ